MDILFLATDNALDNNTNSNTYMNTTTTTINNNSNNDNNNVNNFIQEDVFFFLLNSPLTDRPLLVSGHRDWISTFNWHKSPVLKKKLLSYHCNKTR